MKIGKAKDPVELLEPQISKEPSSDFSSLSPMAQCVVNGEIDGFFLPYDLIALVPTKWPDGTPTKIYRSARGFLVFRPEAYYNYGVSSEVEFTRSVLLARLVPESLARAISLGSARCITGRPWRVQLTLAGLGWPLEFLAQNEAEAESIQTLLNQLLATSPHQTRISQTSVWTPPQFTYWFRLLRSLGKLARPKKIVLLWLLLVMIAGVATVTLAFLGILPRYSEYLALSGVLFILWKSVRLLN